jgi:hypothetical protein
MSTANVKLVVWTVAGLIGASVVAYVALFFRHKDEVLRSVSTGEMLTVLENVDDVPRTTENIVAVDLVERGLKRFDWTGKPPPPPPEPTEKAPDEGPPREQVAKLIQIQGIRFDAESPLTSEVVFKYTSEARVIPANAATDGTTLKQVGQKLDGRLNQIEIAAIYPNAVEFAFTNEPAREHEFVGPQEFDLQNLYAVVGEGQEVRSPRRPDINVPIVPAPTARQTQMLSRNRYRLGVEDIAYIDENFPEIMTTEVELAKHRDPKTKRVDGIELKRVAAGSIAERHGVETGDVIKSINGHPVTSEEEAILFVKNHKDEYDRWEVEVWNKGQTRTIVYYPPKK